MKLNLKRIAALLLILLMTASLLASCSQKSKEGETADTYLAENVDLGLAENEKLMDIIEVDGELRATVGVTNDELEARYGTDFGTPYKTEYRYYDMAFAEDTAKREPTASFHQIAQASDPSLNITIGGEPYLYTDENGMESSYGVRYYIYKDGEKTEHILNPRGETGYGRYTKYNARANLVMVGDIPYVWLDYTDLNIEVFVNDHFLQYTEVNPDVLYGVDGVIGIGENPFLLVHGAQRDHSKQDSYYFYVPVWQGARLVPLTSKTIELSLEGKDIEGEPSGGAFSDGTYGYYLCGSELWRTDGESGVRITDLAFCGVDMHSNVCAIRSLSDGRILVVANDGLITLTESDSVVPVERSVYTIGVIDTGYFDEGSLAVSAVTSRFNSHTDNCKFVVKGYRDISKLNLALLSGEVDIISINDRFALNNYAKQGILAPLEDVVPELFEEGVLIKNIVDAARVGDTCYYLPREFDIYGMEVECRLLDEGQTFKTPKEYYDFIREKDPGYFKHHTPNTIMQHFAPILDEWINWDKNTCHFDDGTFEATLEFCNEGTSYEEIDASVLTYTGILSFCGFKQYPFYESLFTDVEAAKEYLAGLEDVDTKKIPISTDDVWARVIIPYPSTIYDGYEIWTERYFAVVDKKESLDAAREFMKWYFLENVVGKIAPDDPEADYQDWDIKGIYHFSINQAECERYVGRNLTWNGKDKETRLPREQRWYEDTWKLIQKADHYVYERNAIFDVMNEEAARYFAGDITSKQAAEYVQNRISIYLAEQS